MITYEALADATLAQRAVPAVVPQLKSITLGGAVAGVGIEASSFRHGLVHDTITSLDVLTGDGRIVTCTPDNEHRDLFFGFPNSYGTLGYALKLTARTVPAQRFVELRHVRLQRPPPHASPTSSAAAPTAASISSTASCSRADELYLTLGRFVDDAPEVSDYRLRADLLPVDPRALERCADRARLPVALGHRLVLVLEEHRRAASAGPAAARPQAPQFDHLPEGSCAGTPPRRHARDGTASAASTPNR